MKRVKICKHCNELFEARRSNHLYCNTSCKTKASYKRNDYKYVSGHYQKMDVVSEVEDLNTPIKSEVIESIKILEQKIDSIQNTSSINKASVTNAAMGSAAADATVFAVKKIFAPNSLPATKGDVIALKNELNELKKMIQIVNSTKTHFFNV
jgi:hypothetical protein